MQIFERFSSGEFPTDSCTFVSPNRELVALGAANIVASFISGTVPGYGSITRSRLAGQTGARTPMASFLTGTLVLCVTFFLLKFLFYLPKAVLASIICVVVFSILAETPHDVKVGFRTPCMGDSC